MANNYRGMHRASTLFFKLKLPPDYKPPPPKVKRGTEIPPFTEKQLEIMAGNVPNVRRSELTRLVDKLTRMDRGDDIKKVFDMYDHLINPQTTPASRYMPDEADGLLQSLTPWTIPGKEVVEMDESKSFPERLKVAIEMSGMSGLNFAVALKRLCPEAKIIFVTAYSQYAIDAFRLHVHGYILKPITAERVREELDYLIKENTPEQEPAQEEEQTRELLKVQCFGYFEVFWKGEPLMFGRRQTKELLAYLIDRKGATCTSEEIATALWEDEDNLKHLKAHAGR